LIAYLNIILLPKTKSTPAKECLTSKKSKVKSKKMEFQLILFSLFSFYLFTFFSPSFAGIIPSRFIGLFLSFRPTRPYAPLAYLNFSGRILICFGSRRKNFLLSSINT